MVLGPSFVYGGKGRGKVTNQQDQLGGFIKYLFRERAAQKGKKARADNMFVWTA